MSRGKENRKPIPQVDTRTSRSAVDQHRGSLGVLSGEIAVMEVTEYWWARFGWKKNKSGEGSQQHSAESDVPHPFLKHRVISFSE